MKTLLFLVWSVVIYWLKTAAGTDQSARPNVPVVAAWKKAALIWMWTVQPDVELY